LIGHLLIVNSILLHTIPLFGTVL